MQMRYLGKWKRMPWWSHMHHLKTRNKLIHDEMYQLIAPHLGNMEFLKDEYIPDKHKVEQNRERKEINEFLTKFLKKFPEMKFSEIGNQNKVEARQSRVSHLVYYFRELVKRGMHEEAALEHIESKYKDYIGEKRKHLMVANNLAVTNNARSIMDIYQQRAEYEARLKVSRLERDVDMYEFLEKEEIPEYQRHLKITNKKYSEPGEKLTRETLSESIDNYIKRTKGMLDDYYEKAYTRDRLKNLNALEIQYTIKETPTRIKKRSKQILKLMDKHGVTLDDSGDINWSGCSNIGFRKKFENNPWLKYAAMQRDLEYGFPHLEHQRKAAAELKKEVFKARETHKKDEEKRSEVERQEALLRQFSQSEIDKAIGFGLKGEVTQEENEVSKGETILDASSIIEGFSYRMDDKGVLLQPFEERLARLEAKWFKERMANLAGGIEELSEEEIQKKRESIVDRLRRIKILVDRNAIQAGLECFFEENRQLSEEEIMMETVPFERLVNYYKLPRDQKEGSPNDQVEFERVAKAVHRPEIIEDLYDWKDDHKSAAIKFQDTKEYAKLRERKNFELAATENSESLRQLVQARAEEKPDVKVEAKKDKGKKKTRERERKNIVSFLKKEVVKK